MSEALEDRIVLISGAAGTLGRAATLACAASGSTVVLLDKNVKKLEALYDEIITAGGRTPALYPLDLAGASEADFATLAATLEQEFGALHGVLHAATEFGVLGPVLDLGAADVDRILRVNCSAPLQLTRALLPLLTRTGDTAIVFISDSAARQAKAYWGAYGISKIALEGLAHILSAEMSGSGRVRVHTFIPGPFRSPVYLKAFPGGDRQVLPDASALGTSLAGLLSRGCDLPDGPVGPGFHSSPYSKQTGEAHVR